MGHVGSDARGNSEETMRSERYILTGSVSLSTSPVERKSFYC